MPPLPDELVEEVFIRLPPDEPAALVQASLASKPWLVLLTGPAFRGRYREFHGAPPMLGFLYSRTGDSAYKDPAPRFVSTTKFGARIPHLALHSSYHAWDCRHGRVLLGDSESCPLQLVVWDPMTGRTRELYSVEVVDSLAVAVLCAVSGCDHRACHAGPFKVVYLGTDKNDEDGECTAFAWVSSPDTGDWCRPCPDFTDVWKEPCPGLDLAADAFIKPMRVVLVNDALYLLLGYDEHDDDRVGILKYSLSSDSLSLIDAPPAARADSLMAMKDGSLGLAHMDRLTLHLWSRQIDSEGGVATWTCGRVVDLKNLLPLENPKKGLTLIGSVECGDIVFVNTDLGVYEIDLKTLEWKERRKRENCDTLIPYMSFYNPPERVIPGDAAH